MRPVEFKISAGVLRGRAAGPKDGRVMLLLHGFPEFWFGWKNQILPLAEAGYHVVALDQRGYNESSKPAAVRDYTVTELCEDVRAVADQLQCSRILLVGHDWGGIVAWSFAMRHPERLERMVILNAPHPAAARRQLTTSPRQMLRSWYILFFQLPRIPELLFSARNFATGVQSLLSSSAPGTFSRESVEQYRRAWAKPGAIRAMIHWYRALLRYLIRAVPGDPYISSPTQILWGMRDKFLLPELAAASLAYCTNGDLLEFPNASHWIQHEEPERVTTAILEWFGTQ